MILATKLLIELTVYECYKSLVSGENFRALVYQYYFGCKCGQKENWKILKLLSVWSERTCCVCVICIKCI